jgi:hypothetical protein
LPQLFETIMQSKTILTLLLSAAALTSVAAHADGRAWGVDSRTPSASTASAKSRADVKQELLQAQRQGFSQASNFKHYPGTQKAGSKTRAEVRTELTQAKADGTSAVYQH